MVMLLRVMRGVGFREGDPGTCIEVTAGGGGNTALADPVLKVLVG